MPVTAFEHVNTRSADVERTRDFYQRLGLRAGDRPPFASTGYWMYLGDRPMIHLVQRKEGEAHHDGSGNVDHVAFHATDLEATKRSLAEAGLEFREAVVPRDNTVQLFVRDPDGVMVELNFAGQ